MRATLRLAVAVGAGLLLVGAAAVPSSTSAGTDVTIDVQRMASSNGAMPIKAQYTCTATVRRGGEVLTEPRIQTMEGQEARVMTTTDGGVKVTLTVLVPSPQELTYDLTVASAGSSPERHRASIKLRP